MSNADYLWSVAKGLRREVRPHIGDDAVRENMDNAIRVLTTLANALEEGPGTPASLAVAGDPVADTDRLLGPPDNPAAYRSTGAAIAAAAARITDASAIAAEREAVSWEKTLLDAAIARVDAVERAAPIDAQADPNAVIDPERVQAYLRHWTGNDTLVVTSFRAVPGGRSRQTALLSLDGTALSDDLPRDLVLQRAYPGLAANDAFLNEEQQFAILKDVYAAGMKVPRPILAETEIQWLDAPFTIVERSPGRTAQSDYWLPLEDGNVAIDLARQMALLHSQPVATTGAGLRAQENSDAAGWKADLEFWAGKWESMALWPSVTMSALIAWLRANVECLDDRACVIHNDMVFHNIMAEDGSITAVLDWEQAAIGHPGQDLGYCYPAVIAATSWDDFMAAYREAGGPDVPQRQIDYFALRALLRLMFLVLIGGRDSFQKQGSDSILVASAGAHFTQRLLHRTAVVLDSILVRG